MSDAAIASPIFSGTVAYSLDAKNRVSIPSRWRVTDADEFFLMPDRTSTFLRAMPPKEFSAVAERIAQNPAVTPKDAAAFKRRFFSSAVQVVADKQGRILVPDHFCKLLDLRGEVVFAGAHDTFEIWNKARWEAGQQSEAPTYDRVAELAGL